MTFPYVLRESLKWLLNKNNKLKHSLKSLNEEDIELIKSVFVEVGTPLNI